MGAHEDLNRYRMTRVCIEDEAHAELHGEYPTFEEAVLELQRRALVPWDQPPKRRAVHLMAYLRSQI
jgi:hypothetical protein